jgi:hypothetical protein
LMTKLLIVRARGINVLEFVGTKIEFLACITYHAIF